MADLDYLDYAISIGALMGEEKSVVGMGIVAASALNRSEAIAARGRGFNSQSAALGDVFSAPHSKVDMAAKVTDGTSLSVKGTQYSTTINSNIPGASTEAYKAFEKGVLASLGIPTDLGPFADRHAKATTALAVAVGARDMGIDLGFGVTNYGTTGRDPKTGKSYAAKAGVGKNQAHFESHRAGPFPGSVTPPREKEFAARFAAAAALTGVAIAPQHMRDITKHATPAEISMTASSMQMQAQQAMADKGVEAFPGMNYNDLVRPMGLSAVDVENIDPFAIGIDSTTPQTWADIAGIALDPSEDPTSFLAHHPDLGYSQTAPAGVVEYAGELPDITPPAPFPGGADPLNSGAYPQSGPTSLSYSPYPTSDDPMNAGAYPSSGPTSITPNPFADWQSPEGRPTLGHNGGPPLEDIPGEYGGKSFSPASEPGFSLPLMAADIYTAPGTGFPITPLDRFGLLPASFTPSTGWAETFPGEYGGKAFTAPQSYPEEQAFSTPYTPSPPDITEALIQFGVDPFAPGAFASPPESYPGEYGGKSFTPSAPYSGPDYGDVGNKSFTPAPTFATAGGLGGDGFSTGGGFGGEPGWTNPDGSSMRYVGDSPREHALAPAPPRDDWGFFDPVREAAWGAITGGIHSALDNFGAAPVQASVSASPFGSGASDISSMRYVGDSPRERNASGWASAQAAPATQPVGLPSDMSPRGFGGMSPTQRQEENNAVKAAYEAMRTANEALSRAKSAGSYTAAKPAAGFTALDSPRERLAAAGIGPGQNLAGKSLGPNPVALAQAQQAAKAATAQYNAAKAAAARAATAPAPRAAGPALSGGIAPAMAAAFAPAVAVGSHGGRSFSEPLGGGVNYGQLLDFYGGPLGAPDPWGNSLPGNVSIDRGFFNQDGSLNTGADVGGGVSLGGLMDFYSSDPGTSDPWGGGSWF